MLGVSKLSAAVLELASLDNLWSARYLLLGLVLRQVRSGYVGSAGGWLWLVLRPLMTLVAYYFVFDVVLSVRLNLRSTGTDTYALYLLAGLIPWLAWSDGVVQGTSSLVESSGIVRKTRFPVELIPARSVLAAATGFLPFTLLVGVIAMVLGDGRPLGLLMLLPWLLLQIATTYYLALALAVLTAALRDIGQLVQSLFGMLIFFSPILFPLEQVPALLRHVLWLNPFTPLVNGYHAILLQGVAPGWLDLTMALGWCLLWLLVARFLLVRSREQLVDWL